MSNESDLCNVTYLDTEIYLKDFLVIYSSIDIILNYILIYLFLSQEGIPKKLLSILSKALGQSFSESKIASINLSIYLNTILMIECI